MTRKRYYTGRSPLEAISMSIEMEPGDVAFRCNLVTLSEAAEYADRIMLDYSADEIGSDEAARLIETVNAHFASESIRFYPGKSYRHCLIWKNGPLELDLVPPHDILTRRIGEYLPAGKGAEPLLDMMSASTDILPDHPVNKARSKRQLNPGQFDLDLGSGHPAGPAGPVRSLSPERIGHLGRRPGQWPGHLRRSARRRCPGRNRQHPYQFPRQGRSRDR